MFLGGTPGNTQSPAWQKCEQAALNKNIKVVAHRRHELDAPGRAAGDVRLS